MGACVVRLTIVGATVIVVAAVVTLLIIGRLTSSGPGQPTNPEHVA
jgi:hypothetical protein